MSQSQPTPLQRQGCGQASAHGPCVPAVDWDKVRQQILCPLCEYDLRGLGEPRCPECGYRFSWADLLDSSRRIHPYAFEHHPRHNVWSFFRTLVGGLRPRNFWTALHPAQPSCVRRLLLYWLICSAPQLILIAAICTLEARQLDWQNRMLRARFPQDRKLQSITPLPPRRAFFRDVLVNVYEDELWGPVVVVAGLTSLWPWLTFFAMLAFVESIARRRLRATHALRCAAYCADAAVWFCVLAVAVFLLSMLFVPKTTAAEHVERTAIVLLGSYLLLFNWRLVAACRWYMQFDHPLATVLVSQIIALLAAFTALAHLEKLI